MEEGMIQKRRAFIRKIVADVWQRLDDAGFGYSFGEIRKHFNTMFDNPEVQEEVADVFYDRFISV